MLKRDFPQGANFSGKSILLKQIALITYMAHIGQLHCIPRGFDTDSLLTSALSSGCFVPAEDALIGLTDRIMTRVSTRESITRVMTPTPLPAESSPALILCRIPLLQGSSAFMIDLQQIS